MNIRLLTLTAAFLSLVGCATTNKTPSNDSFALKVVKAANMNKNLRDSEVPKDTITSLDSAVFKSATLVSGYSMPLPGFSGGAMLGAGLLNLLAADEPAAKNSIIIWMPADLVNNGKSAQEVMHQVFFEAFKKLAVEGGYGLGNSYFHAKKGFMDIDFSMFELQNDKGPNICADKLCRFSIDFGEIITLKSDSDIKYLKSYGILQPSINNESFHFFSPNKTSTTKFGEFKNFASGLNELAFIQKFSSYLPAWVFIYIAPNKVKINAQEKIMVPMIINQGKFNYFVTEKQL